MQKSYLETKSFYIVFILLGVVLGWFLKKPIIDSYSQKEKEYCEVDGVYFKDAGEIYEVLRQKGYILRGMDYAFVCNINELSPKEISTSQEFIRYGVTKGNVSEIPPEIKLLENLEFLQIHNQKIDTIPPEVNSLTKLKQLRLGGNKLTKIPKEIGNLNKLEVLHLYGNRIDKIPEEIGNLKSLRILDLHSNSLSSLPEEIGELSENLHRLYLGGNSFSEEEKNKLKTLLPKTQIYF